MAVAAIPWYWLCKGIAFDWSSTDNLNELIARRAAWGAGGGLYLYVLLLLICANAVLLAKTCHWRVGALAATLVAVPVSWWLLNHGLEPNVRKYNKVFSGVQFLLGPDRSHLLPATALFLRWTVVYVGGVLLLSVGYRLGSGASKRWSVADPRSPRPDASGKPSVGKAVDKAA